ncbi:MAG: hypothetical protein QOI52_457 [Chloroflexota bacterium]|nr:hypothetical protein [Chloroflexota bacterium]
MSTSERFDESISGWLEQTAPARLPDRVLEATFERTRMSRQQIGWRAILRRAGVTWSVLALGGTAAVVAIAAVVALDLFDGRPAVGGPSPSSGAESVFSGTWVSTSDADGGTQTMTVRVSAEGVVEIVVTDDIASVCSRTPSTMTGTGRLEGDSRLVIPAPVYTCDDGTVAVPASGAPLQQQLRNLTFVRDANAGYLTDNFRGMWLRGGGAAPSPASRASLAPRPSGSLAPQASGTMWPQSSLEEVRQAQALADAGDRAYTWQVDPQLSFDDLWLGRLNQPGAEIAERFLREEMGWDKFLFNLFVGELDHGAADRISGIGYMRCGPGDTNPLYPGAAVDLMTAPLAEPCAPSIDELRYESVILELTQPGQGGPTGIWVVSGWQPTAPFAQADPDIATAEAQALVEDYLQARIEGKGAEGGVDVRGASVDMPLLYATTSGASYERYEIERMSGPTWPFGSIVFKVRLFADGGETVVEQQIQWDGYGLRHDVTTTTENGQPVPLP